MPSSVPCTIRCWRRRRLPSALLIAQRGRPPKPRLMLHAGMVKATLRLLTPPRRLLRPAQPKAQRRVRCRSGGSRCRRATYLPLLRALPLHQRRTPHHRRKSLTFSLLVSRGNRRVPQKRQPRRPARPRRWPLRNRSRSRSRSRAPPRLSSLPTPLPPIRRTRWGR